ncbi:unnamed protein product [Phytophthora lilii]|uniref:Unnamed protein product n=1 Tax=Phytophthora lilii TaxID=2077276 RepID=A0A9W6WZP5_9STRA|nr:unnamed protein product [Phytophthora lilii]
MTGPDMSDKEMEAGISLLHMMQPSEPDVAAAPSPAPESRDALHASLLKVVATQASDELSLPRVAAAKSVRQRGAHLNALAHELTLEELRPHFGKPIVEVAREFGICTTFLKKMCRRCGIKRWPHRQIRSLNRTIQMLEQVEAVATNPQERARYTMQIEELKEKQRAVMENPDANGRLERRKKYSAPKWTPASTNASVPAHIEQECESFVAAQRDPNINASNDSTGNLSALAVAVDSIVSPRVGNATEASAITGLLPLDVQIPQAIAIFVDNAIACCKS